MKNWSSRLAFSAFMLGAALPGYGQQTSPNVGYLYPAGARQGATVEVLAGGQFLDGAGAALFSNPGLRAEVIEHVKPLTQKQFNDSREELRTLQDKRTAARASRRNNDSRTNVTWTATDETRAEELRKKLAKYQRRPMSPAIAEHVRLKINVETNTPPGIYELRLSARQGLSNPLFFCVGQEPEQAEIHPSEEDDPPGKPLRFNAEISAVAASLSKVTLPATVNGQIMPGGVDRYQFRARKGERFVAVVSARELVPYLADAVPGWFQATLRVFDSKGKELAYNDDFRFQPDPVLQCEIPEYGDYTLEIKDAIFRGREDFVYRVQMGTLPFITTLFPLGGKTGERTDIAVSGWNLPGSQTIADNSQREPGIYWVCVTNDARISNKVPFAVDTLPELVEHEPNPADAPQHFLLPVTINGRIADAGEEDVFRFEGKAAQTIAVEVLARRLGSPLDSQIELLDAKGTAIAQNDDFEDKGAGLETHHADSWLSATLPRDGTYRVRVRDAQGKAGPDYAYRLRVSEPRPDFALRVVPSSLNARSGASTPVTVYAMRKDGYKGPIKIEAKNAPAGLQLSGATIPEGEDQVRFTLVAPPLGEITELHLQGRATIKDEQIVHPAVPAEDRMQAFAYKHLVPSSQMMLFVSGTSSAKNATRVVGDAPVRIPVGGVARFKVAGGSATSLDRYELELSDPPEGVKLGKVSVSRDGAEITVETDAGKVKQGAKGNLIVAMFSTATKTGPKAAKQLARRYPAGILPAIPFEVVPQ